VAWQIQSETLAKGSTHYHLLATIDDGGEHFTLETSWEQCLYMVHTYSGTEPAGDAIVAICIFADDDPSKFAHQIMRMTESDTGARLRKIDAKLQDAFVVTSDLRRSTDW
jgi:hypothetical protein